MRVAVAFDHRGVKLRERLLQELAALGHETVDLGTDKPEPRIDYPDKAREVAEAIRLGAAERALFVCGSGVGAAVAANKVAGIRAAICHDTYSAHQGVEHDDMNVLCLGSEVVGAELAAELARVFLAARFDGGDRYVRRLEKIKEACNRIKKQAMSGMRATDKLLRQYPYSSLGFAFGLGVLTAVLVQKARK